MTPPVRRLIVNADDFGQTAGVNDGIVQAHEQGIVTSASLMVRWPFARGAATYARSAPALSVGLHLDLGEWKHRAETGAWEPIYQRVPLDDAAAVRAEIQRQLELFDRVMHREPTHIDSHQHIHKRPLIRDILFELAAHLRVPIRHAHTGGVRIAHCGDFYGADRHGRPHDAWIAADRLIDLLRALPPGITELSCHPGLRADTAGMYRASRALEVQALCDPRVRAALVEEGIALIAFHDVARAAVVSAGEAVRSE